MEKKLFRANEGKMICGVCAGLAEYLNVDPTVVRIAMVFAGFCGVGLIGYIAAAIIMPEKPSELN